MEYSSCRVSVFTAEFFLVLSLQQDSNIAFCTADHVSVFIHCAHRWNTRQYGNAFCNSLAMAFDILCDGREISRFKERNTSTEELHFQPCGSWNMIVW